MILYFHSPWSRRSSAACPAGGYQLRATSRATGQTTGIARRFSPVLCTGDFSGSGETEYAVFVLGNDERPSYKVLALTPADGDLVAHELMADKHSPQNMFLKTMKPGYYRRSELVRGAGEPSVVHLKRQGINLGTFESADYLVFWDGQRFKQWWMSD